MVMSNLASPKSGNTFGDLSPSHRRLLMLLQDLYFGRVEHLSIVEGQVQFDPAPQLVQEWKFGGTNSARSGLDAPNICLKAQHRELLALIERLGNGVIESIEVQHGLPFRASLRRTLGN